MRWRKGSIAAFKRSSPRRAVSATSRTIARGSYFSAANFNSLPLARPDSNPTEIRGEGKKGQHLDDLEHPEVADEPEYKKSLKQTQLKLLNYQRAMSETKRSLLVIFEGPDAAGKGGAIKRFVERLDP